MRYFVTVAGRTVEVELTGDTIRVGGRLVAADLRPVAGSALRHLIVDGRSVPIALDAGDEPGTWDVHVGGRRFTAEVLDERARAIREMTGTTHGPRGPKPVRAPMPGLVVRLEVEPGQTVKAGQGIIIVEAMKMENELKADTAGIVSKILVAAGQPVDKGTVLVEFEAAT